MTDRPRWMERVEDMVGNAPAPRYLIQALMDDSLRPYIQQAARKRGMPVSHYYRRAVLAFVAHDLGMEFTDLAQKEPPIPEGHGLPPRWYRGEGFGKWRIRKLD